MRFRVASSLTAAALCVLAWASSAQAAITVANQNDSGPGSLREAIATAPGGELIVLPAGTYTLTSEPLLIKKSLTISGHSAADTTIRAGGSFGVIFIIGPGEVNLNDLTIRDGNIVGSGSGAGISSTNADLALNGVSVVHNTINANGAPGNVGGSASGAGVFFVGPSLEITNSSVSENSSFAVGGSGKNGGSVSGGGLFAVVNTGRLRIAGSTIASNVTDVRGGQGPSSAEQYGGTVSGGGYFIVANSPSSSRVDSSTFSNNSADASGGPGGSNGSVSGGGIFEVTNSAPMTYTNVTIAGNTARLAATGGTASGGGIFVVANQPVSLFNTTIASNRIEGGGTAFGGNAYLINKVFFKNSIFANGSGPAGSENCFMAGGPTSLGFNIDSLNQCGLGATGDKATTNPLLGPLQNNGGPTATMAPAGNSPAVDQGNSVGFVDQRGVTRPIDFPSIANAPGGDGSDIGAVELQPASGLTLGKLVKNKKKGTGTLTVALPTPSAGTLSLSGKGLKSQTVAITGQGEVKLKVATKGGASKSLRKKGSLKVKLEVTYAPTANSPISQSRSVKLVRKTKKHHHKR